MQKLEMGKIIGIILLIPLLLQCGGAKRIKGYRSIKKEIDTVAYVKNIVFHKVLADVDMQPQNWVNVLSREMNAKTGKIIDKYIHRITRKHFALKEKHLNITEADCDLVRRLLVQLDYEKKLDKLKMTINEPQSQ